MKKLLTKKGFTLLEALVAISIILVAISTAFTIIPQGQAAIRHIRNQITATYLAQEAIEVVRNHRDKYMLFSYDELGRPLPDWQAENIPEAANYANCVTEVSDLNIKQCEIDSFVYVNDLDGVGEDFDDQFIACGETNNSDDVFNTTCTNKLNVRSIDLNNDGNDETVYGYFDPTDYPDGEVQETKFTRWVEIRTIRNATGGLWEQEAQESFGFGDPIDANIAQDDIEMEVTAYVIWNDRGDKKYILRDNLFYWYLPIDHGQ